MNNNNNPPTLAPHIAAQCQQVGSIRLVFDRANPFYPVGEPVAVPVYRMTGEGGAAPMIHWGEGVIALAVALRYARRID